MPLTDRVAIVTGASSGIGAAVARALAQEGATVVAVARRAERLEALADEIRAAGGAVHVAPTDVSQRDQVDAMAADAVARFGRIDILVNNAGIMPLSPLADARVDEWERMVDVNVKGVLYALGAVLPVMVDQKGGHVVNVGSLAGRRPFPGGTVYAATKFAVRALSWGMHLELGAEHGIRVTDIQPGVTSTELFDHIEDADTREGFKAGWAGRRTLQPEDVARAIVHVVTSPEHVSISELLIRPTDQPT